MARIEQAPALIHAQGCKAGILMPNIELARQCAAWGFDFVAVGSDLAFMLNALRGNLQAWGTDSPPSTAPAVLSGY